MIRIGIIVDSRARRWLAGPLPGLVLIGIGLLLALVLP